MLELVDIKKRYGEGESAVDALKGVSLKFRENEFVSILGQSGCGKTTLLNIVGGLDQYTSGDLIINGKSTKKFKDADWDTYRNHSIGFIFQSYNLIPHQSVLSNVELALTLNGISKDERKKRAIEALEKVGLKDQINKRPNQLSGGQMQRVAIARALINNPDILLADEPTGALDSETSVQVMDLLKEIAKDRLVIMVTHNPELAEQYSTRIIKLFDGTLIDDSNPFNEKEIVNKEKKSEKKKKSSMSFFTALSLSFNNLMTKKGRTFLTSFAGSIGIIGIALILSVSTGVDAYISSIEESTMSSYPLMIQESTMNANSVMTSLMKENESEEEREENKIYSNDIMIEMMSAMTSGITTNNLAKFKEYIETESKFKDYTNDIKYSYSANLNTYSVTTENGITTYKKNISGIYELFAEIGMLGYTQDSAASMSSMGMGMTDVGAWSELVGDMDYIKSQYKLVDGKYPENYNEIVLIVDENNQISDYTLYILGIRDVEEIKEYLEHAKESIANGTENTYEIKPTDYTYEEIYSHTFKALLDSDYYVIDEASGLIRELDGEKSAEDKLLLDDRLDDALELKVVGIICPSEDSVAAASVGTIGYLSSLMPKIIERSNNSEVVKAQLADSETDLFTGNAFGSSGYTVEDLPQIKEMLASSTDPQLQQLIYLPDEQLLAIVNATMTTKATYEDNLKKLGYVDMDKPSMISIYPKDFESKDKINELISQYNDKQEEKDKINYTDTVALLMSSVTTIVNAISYVLIAFVAISLIVSSIMIGIITYISVLERTKEIGILRAIGASKKDIARVFNAETLFVGFCAGAIGIGCSLIFVVIINIILHALTGISNLNAILPWQGAIILIIISMILTFVAGLVPSKTASNKDPVIALRTE